MTKQFPLVFLILFVFQGLQAQISPSTKGLFVNASLSGATVFYDEDNLDDDASAGGLEFKIGYGFTPTFTLYATLGGFRVQGEDESPFTEDYDLGIFELAGRFHFGKKFKSPVFYLDGGFQFASARISEDPDITLNGAGLVLGPGLLAYLNRKLALDVNLRLAAGQINDVEIGGTTIDISDGDFRYGISRLNLGVVWYPSNK
ncbi:MAG: outer membrane beta-barrel protein [Bacteroidota bacterium]